MTTSNMRRLAIFLVASLVLVSCVVPPGGPGPDPCSPVINPVACENSKAGSPQSEWDAGVGDASIQGFATQMSVNAGETVHFKINTPATSYVIVIYRLGYYQGKGARGVGAATPSVPLPQVQPPCLTDVSLGLVDCGNWAESASWTVPADMVSGVFVAHLVRTDNNEDNQITFVVRNDASHSKMVMQTSDTTWQAYNDWGGYSLYHGPTGRAQKVSYNRPFATRGGTPWGQDYLMANEYPMIRWIEQNGYDVSYISGIDSDRSGSLLLNHAMFASVGHDEYWSGAQRANVEAARDAGVNLAFFAGNEVFWKTRWEPSVDGTATPYRTLVTYKETSANAKVDPSPEWTGTWRDPRFSPPSDGGRPENALSGTSFAVQISQEAIQVGSDFGKMRFWRNTSLATLADGATGSLPQGVLGYEWDTDPDNGSRPAGLFDLSSTTLPESYVAGGFGDQFAAGTATHNMTTYRAPSGALVFSAGTIQWSWGLDNVHDGSGPAPSTDMRQATVNILADMGAQPGTLATGLVAATMSTDAVAPVATITSPASGANLGNGTVVTVTGTAADSGGGRVAAVEVSLDGGTTWHRASGRENWTYTASVVGLGAGSIRARAVDDSANLQGAPAVRPVTVSCPCSVFGLGDTPAHPSSGDPSAVELGARFTSDVAGWVTGVRFYKGAGNTGAHTGSLWSTGGQRLATVNFVGESSGGWQQATFANAVPITAGTTYVISYFAPSGNYAEDPGALRLATPNPPVHALADGAGGIGNGVFRYGSTGFPSSASGATNYWVDAIVATDPPVDVSPPTVDTQTPLPGASSVATSVHPTATFSEPVQPSTISFTLAGPSGAVAGTTSYDAPSRTATFTPSAALTSGTTYTATVTGTKDLAGNTQTGSTAWTFRTAVAANPPGVCPCSLFNDSDVPAVITENDGGPVELGVRFTSSANGTITGIRFYKGPQNTGVHTGTLWSATGQALATATFSGESTTGWQQVSFSTPVPVSAGVTYIASYHTNAGFYSETPGQFSGQSVDKGPLHAPETSAGAPNGLFGYGPGAFPTSSGAGTGYGVDVVFAPAPDTVAPTIVGRDPGPGATSVAVGAPITATMSERLAPGSATVQVTGPGGAVAGTVSYDDVNLRVSFTPTAPLAAATAYTATLTEAVDLAGNHLAAPVAWSFTTSGVSACPCSLFNSTATPAGPMATDPASVELGVRFTPDTSGWITGVRFYKGAGNTGVHTGSLWASDGTLLATVTFGGESASGWQSATFSAAVAVTAGVTYVASYHAPNGHYAEDAHGFDGPLDNAPLHAPASGAAGNGVYRYGASAFPSSSSAATNYWVDVAFTTVTPPDTTAPLVSATSPIAGASSVPAAAPLTATFNEAIAPGSIAATVTGPGGSVPVSVAYSPANFTATITPTVALAASTVYSVTVAASDLAGNPMPAPFGWTLRTADPTPPPGSCPCTLWGDSTVPSTPDGGDGLAIELGVAFRSDTAGFITGVRFYKAPANVGPHTASLWSSAGVLLATAAAGTESSTGWQQITFTTPVAISAGVTYIASYHTDSGHYALTAGQFTSAGVTYGPLTALAAGVDGANGRYLYGSTGFPTSSFQSSNYWLEPIYVGSAP